MEPLEGEFFVGSVVLVVFVGEQQLAVEQLHTMKRLDHLAARTYRQL